MKNFYVDDLLHSLTSEDEATQIAEELHNFLKKCGFRLLLWSSNHPEVIGSTPASERERAAKPSMVSKTATRRALGVKHSCRLHKITQKEEYSAHSAWYTIPSAFWLHSA